MPCNYHLTPNRISLTDKLNFQSHFTAYNFLFELVVHNRIESIIKLVLISKSPITNNGTKRVYFRIYKTNHRWSY